MRWLILCAPWILLLSVPADAEDDRNDRVWTIDKLAPALADVRQGRSFANGRVLYKRTKCSKCHRMNGDGNEFGPDLTQLDSKWTPFEILRHTLEPSAVVNKQFPTQIFELKSGRVITGMVTAVGRDSLRVIENPLVKSRPVKIDLASIERQRKSRQSIMPTGLLDELSKEEVLDLIAYVYARGNDRHQVFSTRPTAGKP